MKTGFLRLETNVGFVWGGGLFVWIFLVGVWIFFVCLFFLSGISTVSWIYFPSFFPYFLHSLPFSKALIYLISLEASLHFK